MEGCKNETAQHLSKDACVVALFCKLRMMVSDTATGKGLLVALGVESTQEWQVTGNYIPMKR